MQLYLESSFPDDVRDDLKVVARDVMVAVQSRMGQRPPEDKPIVCYYRRQGPLTSVAEDLLSFRVGLAVDSRDYVRLVYQLGHELCHVMMDPRRSNGLIEVIAVGFSLQILDDMAERWRRKPPVRQWAEYAPQFTSYRERVENLALEKMPADVQELVKAKKWSEVVRYLQLEQRKLLWDIEARDLQHVAAMVLRSQPVSWERFWGFGSLTDPPPHRDTRFRSDLAVDLQRAPDALRRIGV